MMVFLFSDIENSTWLWEHHTRQMWKVIARHDTILEDCARQHGGEIVKHTGDGAFVVFREADAALQYAVDVQRQFDREDWGEIGELRIRVGAHAGSAERRSGDYFGPDVNRAARLLSIASAGEILVTPDVLKLCILPEGVIAKDAGVHLLKGLGTMQRVYRLIRSDLVRFDQDQGAVTEDRSEEPRVESYQCTSCLTINLPNTLFCERCGHDLRSNTPADADSSTSRELSAFKLHIPASNQSYSLPTGVEIVLGRGKTGSDETHVIDLGAAGGLDAGVSRRHAALTQRGDTLILEDLGSTNGTYVNRRPVEPRRPTRLTAGDTLHLGQLKIEVIRA